MAFAAAQLSYLAELGMRPDADDQAAEDFARNLNDFERAEFESISAEVVPPAEDDVTRSEEDHEATPSPATTDDTPANSEPIQRDAGQSPADIDALIERRLAEERRVRQQRLDYITQQAGPDIPSDLVQRALREEWDQERTNREFLRAVRNRTAPASAPAGHVRGFATHTTRESLQAGMLLRQGISLDHQHFQRDESRAMLRRTNVQGEWLNRINDSSINRSDSEFDMFHRARDEAHRFRNFSLIDFCRTALLVDGRQVPENEEDMIRRAMSTATLTAIFSTSVNMQILQGYLGVSDTTRGWCVEADVRDFKTNERGRLTKGTGLKKLARGGEAQQIQFDDVTESYKIARYAGQFVVDDQDIIDDTFGGIQEHTPRELGELLGRLRPKLVYAILLANPDMRDGTALFHADHGNLITSSALAAATLASARTKMATQTENGENIENFMRYLIVPEALDFTARQLLNSSELRNAAQATAEGTSNPLQGAFIAVTDPRLDNGVTDPDSGTTYAGSATTWFGANNGRNTIEVGYRRGTGRAPSMETFMLTGARWGMGWKGKLDIGAKALDWRGLLKATA